MCDCNLQCLDLTTPRNVHLTAFYKRSFAYHTVKNRMPVILTQTIDGLTRDKLEIEQRFGQVGQEELKTVIGELSKLKYEIQTNKTIENLTSSAPDVPYYNKYIASQSDQNGSATFFSAIWLLSECYMYRKIREIFELTTRLQHFDPFAKKKQEAFFNSIPNMQKLCQHLILVLKNCTKASMEDFITLLKLNLWGNKSDLSLSNGVVGGEHEHIFNIEALEPNILCDNSQKVWAAASHISAKTSKIIDIVLDNSGYEVFTDLCLADYIISTNLASRVRLYVKTIPWFISDVMATDFNWVLGQLKINSDQSLKALGEKWSKYVNDKVWEIIENDFWTLPVDFSVMKTVNETLYKQLSQAKLVIFKGDLNYRKLFGEKNWDPTTSVDEALQGFHPTKICTLRTIKADIVCGLEPGIADKLEAVDPKWMETGEYGLIQFSDTITRS